MGHFLHDRPLDWSRRETKRLVEILVTAYWERSMIVSVLGTSQVKAIQTLHGEVNLNQGAKQIWRDLLTYACGQLIVKDLVQTILDHKDAKAWADELYAFLKPVAEPPGPELRLQAAEPDQTPAAEAVLDDTLWDLIGRLFLEFALETDDPEACLGDLLTKKFVRELALTRDGNVDQLADLDRVMEALKASPLKGSNPMIRRALNGLLSVPEIAQMPESRFLEEGVEQVKRRLKRLSKREAVEENILSNGEIFLDRKPFREGLAHLLAGNLVFTVKAPLHSGKIGKSYSFQLVRHLAGAKSLKAVVVSHEEATSPAEFIDTLRKRMKVRQPFEFPQDDTAKWNRQACSWLLSEAYALGGNYWFVVDGFNAERRDGLLADLIIALAHEISLENDWEPRLVLLDYEGDLPPEIGNRKGEDTLKPLRKSDLREFFHVYFSTPRENLPRDEDEAEALTNDLPDQAWLQAEEKQSSNQHKPFALLLNQEVARIVSEYP